MEIKYLNSHRFTGLVSDMIFVRYDNVLTLWENYFIDIHTKVFSDGMS